MNFYIYAKNRNQENSSVKKYKVCKKCGRTFQNYEYCPYDGMKLTDVKIANYCKICNKNFPKDFEFCPICGRKLQKYESSLFEQGMIYIPKGKFLYGDDNQVQILDEYFIDKFEVTNYEYEKFTKKVKVRSELSSKDDMPVTNITYYEAKKYCESLNKRLCTEMEWEKAARGPNGNIYSYGNKYNIFDCKTDYDYKDGASIIGIFKKCKSYYQVFDMTGNVAEITADIADNRFVKIKGGAWFDKEYYSKSSVYKNLLINDKKDYIGFRCCKSIRKKEKK